ncbi:MAG: twin-arginine translocation pathway signal protein, partial [Cyclobacteriaceae bacterium]|nr:twin-arginine translocation pathway signal protein [Cyclobacteriaceae bacterium]
MQDWKLENGKMICTVLGRDRNVHLLTRKIDEQTGNFKMSVNTGVLKPTKSDEDWVGFKLGAKGEFNDYRSDAVFGNGINVGITTSGGMFIGKKEEADMGKALVIQEALSDLILTIYANKKGDEYVLKLEIYANDLIGAIEKNFTTNDLIGDLVVVSHFNPGANGTRTTVLENSAWFKNWQLEGEQIAVHDDYAFGPILFAQHTLSDKVLKMTAQLPPLGDKDGKSLSLEVKKDDNWNKISSSPIDKDARTATFKVEDWDDSEDQNYRLSYNYIGKNDEELIDTFEGIIKKNPLDKEEIVVAGFTGNSDVGFPNQGLVANVFKQKPDVLFFSGDQVYEPVGGFGNIHTPLDKAMVDYLRKWILYGWEYREMLRNIPTVSIPDDHDVYHGNIWGAGGTATTKKGAGAARQDTGGYKMPAAWVNMVQRTQTSHLPDPYDATEVLQGIGVYYCDMTYGGISFGIIEDRKFKSAPKMLLPEAKIYNGWP